MAWKDINFHTKSFIYIERTGAENYVKCLFSYTCNYICNVCKFQESKSSELDECKESVFARVTPLDLICQLLGILHFNINTFTPSWLLISQARQLSLLYTHFHTRTVTSTITSGKFCFLSLPSLAIRPPQCRHRDEEGELSRPRQRQK